MKVSQDQGWAPRVELGLLGTSWASRVGQACGGLLGRGGAGREAVELSSFRAVLVSEGAADQEQGPG